MDKWFSLQILESRPEETATIAETLTRHPDFTLRNPNRFRAVLGSLAAMPAGFHHVSGRGYRLLAEMLRALDPLNPQAAARMSAAFETWRRHDPARQALVAGELDRLLATPGLSRDMTEMLRRIRGA